jgi:transcription-repair coupling factor (superfamily II helicase)
MKGLVSTLMEKDDVLTIINGIEEGLKEQLVTGLSGSSRHLFAACLYKKMNRPLFIVTYNMLQAQKIYEDLGQIFPSEQLYLYPADELIAADLSVASPELRAQRIETINFLCKNEQGIVIAPIAGLRKILPPKKLWESYLMQLRIDDEIDLEETIHAFVQMGYSRNEMVSAPGEFSVRGGIIDIYPLTEENPIRIELFDNVIDSVRYFNIHNQRSLEKLDSIIIGPATEILLEASHYERLAGKLEQALADSLKKIRDEKVKESLVFETEHDLELIKQGQQPEQIFKYLSFAYEKPASLIDYLMPNTIICMDEISRIVETKDSLEKEEGEWQVSLIGEGKLVHSAWVSHDAMKIIQEANRPIVYFSLFLRHIQNVNPQNIINISGKQMQNFHGQMNILKTEMDRWQKSNFTVIFLGADEKRVQNLNRVLDDYSIDFINNLDGDKLLQGKSQIIQGQLNSGFELPMYKLAVITEAELFNKKMKKRPSRSAKLSNAEKIQSYSELKVGDYVVHVNHGIGKYLGITTLEINGVHKDYLQIKYQGTDKLFVPIDQINLVQKYVGATEGKEPKLYKLGGSEWKRVKRKVQSSVEDIADDLIKLYAEREASKGYAFSPDGDMQREFEASFPYKETEDQLRSIQEIKKDMERSRPMDRLLCGDVGYGKTEVALRSAFKAIMDGKQVAFLVPTTILAQQHYETMQERFADYPIKIGILNRFRTRKEQQETIKGLKNGTVDIVVGTHRLLSKDVTYHDLGLLIIDEEQRFGVTHKEKIKKLKTNVDVLTLTATPIPRTLHMSLLGVRDLSVIETPPENRFPIQTYVMEMNLALVKEAIERELAREGQVYYLYNHIEDIERKAEEISMLVPDAKVLYAHGRMTERELENVILSFLEGEADVLVTTTIIETGVDIPNVNTLIVENADRMGLSQLYQLRGRVGRSNRVAYAYFTYKKDKVLTEVAEKRLQAIKEFTELGSGFKIAMRDLSIRGTGNILGAQQHGFIESVGFDLYSQMLKEEIEKRKGDLPKQEEHEVEIDIDIDAYIPDRYIRDGYQKIEMYKRFRGITEMEEIRELQDEMIDRYGDYPDEVDRLFTIAKMKVIAKQVGIETVKKIKDDVQLIFSEEASKNIRAQELVQLYKPFGRKVGFGMDGEKFKIVLYTTKMSVNEWFPILASMVDEILKIADKEVKTVS